MLQTVFESRVIEPILQPTATAPCLQVLVVDDNSSICTACAEIVRTLGYFAETTSSAALARVLMGGRTANILLMNLPPGDEEALDFVREVHLLYPHVAIIGMTTSSTVNSAVNAMREGARDYLIKPFTIDELSAVLDRRRQRARQTSPPACCVNDCARPTGSARFSADPPRWKSSTASCPRWRRRRILS
jgi:DNA-binding NtrC family response regulator